MNILDARCCVWGDQKIIVINSFNAYAPVLLWQTIKVVFILSKLCKWISKKVDYTGSFIHATLDMGDYFYVWMAWGIRNYGLI